MPKLNELSIVVPFFNEEETAQFVLQELVQTVPGAEIIAVDDGSRDRTWGKIRSQPGVVGLKLPRNLGQSAAIYYGLRSVRRPICGLMDGDGQNDPRSFIPMLEALESSGVDVVCGYRGERKDTWSRRIASRLANSIRRSILRDGIRDTGCTQKVFRREAVELLVPFRGMHRYLPAIFRQGGLQIAEVAVSHRPRQGGTSKYTNWRRGVEGAYDLFGVGWLLRRKLPWLPSEAIQAHGRNHLSSELLR